ncbi:ribosomal RNA processing protein 36 homolog [Ischnura elegans]|uniref:ribosomal RNA processing protein 36 homolog n=1 Tax=Ischnura elegans TaxID=197161 RepID=UPI001ED877B8|nr:ribosomal RNA processing protein 36 homolog [Ischnura elegans]
MKMETDMDCEGSSIREELSQMSFEELQKLKEKLGAKVYNEAMFGHRKVSPSDCKRKNKNRPREMSSKVPVPLVPKIPAHKQRSRDPRFDSLCGSFNERVFRNAYRFVDDIRLKEREQLKSRLKEESDPEGKEKLQYLLTRLENQDREEKRKREKEDRLRAEKESRINALRQGKLPKFKSKAEAKVEELVDNYEKLKKTGKLRKHIEKQRKRNTQKDRKKLVKMANNFDRTNKEGS